MTRDDIEAALGSQNVQAFLRLIREGESGQDDDAYREVFGGGHFDAPPWAHPKGLVQAGGYSSSAAGAYQILAGTWAELVGQYGFEDFSPACQDQAAVALIWRRGALDDVLSGRVRAAIAKCGHEWASLPGAGVNQPEQHMVSALAVYEQYGGVEAEA